LPYLPTKQITMLNTLYPELIRMPNGLDTLELRIWFAPRTARAYLLGIDMRDGLPSDEFVSERLQRLKQLGIERYASEITGIEMDANKRLTGKIGTIMFPQLTGKSLLNKNDLFKVPLRNYYPHDLYFLITEDDVIMITRKDMELLMPNNNFDELCASVRNNIIPYLIEPPSSETLIDMFTWFTSKIATKCGSPARIKLVETMSWDMVTY